VTSLFEPSAWRRRGRGTKHAALTYTLRLACGGLAVIATTAFLSCGAASRRADDRPTPHFAVFAAHRADDALPPELTAALTGGGSPQFSTADIGAARRVLASAPVWLVPASPDKACIVRIVYPLPEFRGKYPPAFVHTCVTESEAQEGALVETQILGISARTSPTRVIGIVPDGVGLVTITASRGPSATVPVVRNAYEATLAKPTTVIFRVRYHGQTVRRTISVRP
jgi:hypothetical protein